MRTNRDGQRRFFVTFTKFTVLIMCFATVFALVLTAGVFDIGSGAGQGANVAEAGENGTAGVADIESTITTDEYKSLHANLKSSAKSFTWALDFVGVDFRDKVHSKANWPYTPSVIADENGSWGASITSSAATSAYTATNVKIPSVITDLVERGYTVGVTWTLIYTKSGGPSSVWRVGFNVSNDIADGNSDLEEQYWTRSNANNTDSGQTWPQGGTPATIENGETNINFLIVPDPDGGVDKTTTATVSNTSTLTFHITKPDTAVSDGHAPEVSGVTVAPRVSGASGYALNGDIKADLSGKYTDSGSESAIDLSKAVVKKNAMSAQANEDGSTMAYSKSVSMDLWEVNAERISANGNSLNTRATYYAGLGAVTISQGGSPIATTGVVYDGEDKYVTFKYNGGAADGLIVLSDMANARSQARLAVYFADNTTSPLTLSITDSGGSANKFEITVGGIAESLGATPGTGPDKSLQTDPNNLTQWISDNYGGFNFYNNYTNGAYSPYSPLIWFFAAEKSEEKFEAIDAAPEFDPESATPFAYGTADLSGITYDFDAGTMKGANAYDGNAGATGPGYYRFTFYVMDYAGNVSSTELTLCAKVDNEDIAGTGINVEYEILRPGELTSPSYATGDSDNYGVIDFGEDVWAGTAVTVTITFNESFSGNRVEILGADGKAYYVYIKGGSITKVSLGSNPSNSSLWTGEGNTRTMSGSTFAKVTAVLQGSEGALTLTLTYEGAADAASQGSFAFAVRAGEDVKTVIGSTDSSKRAELLRDGASDTTDKDTVEIKIDTKKPDGLTVTTYGGSEEAYQTFVGTLPAEIKWHTSAWVINTQFATNAAESGDAFKYYYEVVRYTTPSAAEKGYNAFLSDYKAAGTSVFDGIFTETPDNIAAAISIDYKEEGGAGFYVIYFAATDRAGNKSDLAVYGVFVDATDYILSAQVKEGYAEKLGEAFTEKFMNSDDKSVATVKRGEKVTFVLTPVAGAGAYVPYEYKINSDGETSFDAKEPGGAQVVITEFSDSGNLGEIEENYTVTYSYRRQITVSFNGSSVTYNGETVDIGTRLFFRDETMTGESGETDVDLKGEKPYKLTIDGKENFEIINAGKYAVSVAKAENDYFILENEISSQTFEVTKRQLTIQPTVENSSLYYGEVTNTNFAAVAGLGYTLSGLVGQDKDKSLADLGITEGDFTLQGASGAEAYYLEARAGSLFYTVSYAGAAYEEGATQNYSISYGTATFNVEPRGIELTGGTHEEIVYGGLPSAFTFLLAAFGWDTLGKYDADAVAALFGEGATAEEAEGGWKVTIPASGVTHNGTLNKGGFLNQGDYAITGAVASDGNFTVTAASGSFKVSPVTVTVSAIAEQSFTVDDESGISDIKVLLDDSGADIDRFGITGHLLVGSRVEEGGRTYYVSGDASGVSAAHNAYKEGNVVIKVDTTCTVTVILTSELGGTVVITFKGGEFTTEFGKLWDRNAFIEGYTSVFLRTDGVQDSSYGIKVNSITVTVNGYDFDNALNNTVRDYTMLFSASVTVTQENGEPLGGDQFTVAFKMQDEEGDVDLTNGATLSVTKATVILTSVTAETDTKVYGAEENWQFVYTFEDAEGGNVISAGYEVKGLSLSREDGGDGRYDDVGDYGVTGFACSDSNVTVKTAEGVFDSVILHITQLQIRIDDVDIVLDNPDNLGNGNRRYTGTSKAPVDNIDIADMLINGDAAEAIFRAEYYSAVGTTASEVNFEVEGKTAYMIGITGLSLTGKDANNYMIVFAMGGDIYYTDALYYIYEGQLMIRMNDFIVSKQYDGTTGVESADISFDTNFALRNETFEVTGGSYAQSNVGNGIVVRSLTIFFPGSNAYAEGEWGTEQDKDVVVDAGIRLGSRDGKLVVIIDTFRDGVIVPREIGREDIEFAPFERMYDGTTEVSLGFAFTDEFAGQIRGFDAESVGLSFTGETGSKDVGPYNVEVTGEVTNGNYKLAGSFDITDAGMQVEYKITPRVLSFSIVIEDAVYDGESAIDSNAITYTLTGKIDGEGIGFSRGENGEAYYSDETGEKYAYVQRSADGGWLHDITITELTFKPGSGFDWKNYTFASDVITNKPTSGTDSVKIDKFIIEDAAVMKPREVSITFDEHNVYVGAVDKVYDGTDKVTLTFDKLIEKYIVAADKPYFLGTGENEIVIGFTADASIAGNNYGVGERGVSAKNFRIWYDDSSGKAQEIYNSYQVSFGGSASFKVNVTPADLIAEFTLPEKVYDGNAYAGVDETKIEYKLTGVEGDNLAQYTLRIYAAGYDPDALDVAEGGNPGFIYGIELLYGGKRGSSFTAAGNYRLVQKDDEGNVHVLEENTSTYYIMSLDEAKKADEDEKVKGKIVRLAEFVYNGETMALYGAKTALTAEEVAHLTGTIGAQEQVMRYADATGSIAPIKLGFTVDVVNNDKFVKDFDDNTSFEKDNVTVGTDYEVTLLDENGKPVGFEYSVTVDSIAFTDANAGENKDVVFVLGGVGSEGGRTNGNYIFNTAENSFTVTGVGRINKIDITAQFNNGKAVEATYGDAVKEGVTYSLKGKSVTMGTDDGGNTYAYIGKEGYEQVFGSVPAEENLYNQQGNVFTQDSNGNLVRIGGTFGAYTLVGADDTPVTDDQHRVIVGEGAYMVAVSQTADNFEVVSGAEGARPQLTVNKRTLGLSVTNGGFTYEYMSADLPAPVFDITGGLAEFDPKADVLGGIGYVFKLGGEKVDLADKEITITADLTGDGYKVALTVSEDWAAKYEVILADEGTDVTVVLPEFDAAWYSAKDEKLLTKVYESGDYVTPDMLLNGIGVEGTEVTIEWKDAAGEPIKGAPVNAGEYTWTATVKRGIGNYYYATTGDGVQTEGSVTIEGSFEITKRAVVVKFSGNNVLGTYTGQPIAFPMDRLTATDKTDNTTVENFLNDVDISFMFSFISDGEAVTEQVNEIVNAGGYKIVLTFKPGAYQGNYDIDDSQLRSVAVSPKSVNITVDPASKQHDVTDGAENCAISFTAEDAAPEKGFEVIYRDSRGNRVDSITKAGVYSYEIISKDTNYSVAGGAKGQIRAYITKVSYVADNTNYLTVDFGANGVTADYTLQSSVIDDRGYVNIVDSRVQLLAGDGEEVTTLGIVKVALSAPTGAPTNNFGVPVTVTALLPDNVSGDYRVYYVAADGTLAELTNYTVNGGYITYTAESGYISNLVFVGTASVGLAWWIWLLVAALAVILIAAAILIAVLVKLHRAPDPIPVEVEPIDSIMPAPLAPAAPVTVIEMAAADVAPVDYDAPAALSKHKQPPIIGIR